MSDYRAVEQFLFREARLMDEHRYAEWLALWAIEAHYWIPCRDDDGGIEQTIALVNEGRAGLEDRVKRLLSGAHYAQDPKSRLSRVIANIEIIEKQDDSVTVGSIFNLTTSRKGRIDIVAGRVTHHLLRQADDFRIASKKILLVNNDEVMTNLTYLV